MALYFFRIKAFSRSKGCRVTRAAAYRAGERILDERTSESYNFSRRDDVLHKEIVLPAEWVDAGEMAWARDRSRLWNAAEHAGRTRNASLAKEIMVVLPPELDAAQRVQLALRFARELSDRFKGAIDVAVHEPRPGGDERNHHAHLLMTARQVTPSGMGPRTAMHLSGIERRARGLGPARRELIEIRARWAELTNHALGDAGIAARVDHRSYRERGIDREPRPALPAAIHYAERAGQANLAGEAIRARYRERLAARARGPQEYERVLRRQQAEAREVLLRKAAEKAARPPPKIRHGAKTREELNRDRRARHATIKAQYNRRQRERRNADRAETNRKQREYYRSRAAHRAALKSADPGHSPTAPPEAASSLIAEPLGPGPPPQPARPGAEESVRDWLAYREAQAAAPAAPDPIQAWLAYREREAHAEGDQSAPHPERDHDASL